MSSGFNRRYFCKNENGRDLFYLDFVFVAGTDLIFIEHSLKYNISNHQPAKILLDKLIQNNIAEVERRGFITLLCDFIKTIPGIEEYYFQDEVLSLNGKYLEDNYSTIEWLIEKKYLPDFTPFTATCNSIFFDAFRGILTTELNSNHLTSISREHFEELIINNEKLQLEYVENYSPNTQFFCLRKEYNHMFYEVYIMTLNQHIRLFFIHAYPQ